MTLREAADMLREIANAKPGQGTLLWRCAEAISLLLEEIERQDRDWADALRSGD